MAIAALIAGVGTAALCGAHVSGSAGAVLAACLAVVTMSTLVVLLGLLLDLFGNGGLFLAAAPAAGGAVSVLGAWESLITAIHDQGFLAASSAVLLTSFRGGLEGTLLAATVFALLIGARRAPEMLLDRRRDREQERWRRDLADNIARKGGQAAKHRSRQ
jgi:hypothetical protein